MEVMTAEAPVATCTTPLHTHGRARGLDVLTAVTPARHSPYPLRTRTPTSTPTFTTTPISACRRSFIPAELGGRGESTTSAAPSRISSSPSDTYQLIVQPVVKTTLSQKDTTASRLEVFVATGRTFDEILHKLWEKFHTHIQGKADKNENGWTCETEVFIDEWKRFFHLKTGKYRVERTRTEQSWNTWLAATRNETVLLVIYAYGDALGKKNEIDDFMAACILPRQRDRAGAAAEVELQQVVEQIKTHWEDVFDAPAVVWRMWGNHIVRNLNRSTWEAAASEDPPDAIARLLRPANSRAEDQLERISHSSNLAIECIDGAMDDYTRLREGWTAMGKAWEAMGKQLDLYESKLAARKRCVSATIRDARPPPLTDVIDPLANIVNVDDHEHAE